MELLKLAYNPYRKTYYLFWLSWGVSGFFLQAKDFMFNCSEYVLRICDFVLLPFKSWTIFFSYFECS